VHEERRESGQRPGVAPDLDAAPLETGKTKTVTGNARPAHQLTERVATEQVSVEDACRELEHV
jgi:hypothetical protein